MLNPILVACAFAVVFCFGILLGIHDTKRTYGIPHKVAPDECEVIIYGRDDLDS